MKQNYLGTYGVLKDIPNKYYDKRFEGFKLYNEEGRWWIKAI